MSPVREAVLDLTSALHNWRCDPSPDNARALLVAGAAVCGHALELERRLSLELEPLPRELELEPLPLCKCGGHFHRQSVTHEKCDACGMLRSTVLYSGASADAG